MAISTFDLRLQNLMVSLAFFIAVQSTANLSKAHLLSIMAIVSNLLDVMYYFFTTIFATNLDATSKAVYYTLGQFCCLVSDSFLFYILSVLTEMYQPSKRVFWINRGLLVVSLLLELAYKIMACQYFISPLFKPGSQSPVFLQLKACWAFLFFAFGVIHLFVISNHHTNDLFATLFLKSGKATMGMLFISIILIVVGIPPVSNIENITQNVTNPIGIGLKAIGYLIVLTKVVPGSSVPTKFDVTSKSSSIKIFFHTPSGSHVSYSPLNEGDTEILTKDDTRLFAFQTILKRDPFFNSLIEVVSLQNYTYPLKLDMTLFNSTALTACLEWIYTKSIKEYMPIDPNGRLEVYQLARYTSNDSLADYVTTWIEDYDFSGNSILRILKAVQDEDVNQFPSGLKARALGYFKSHSGEISSSIAFENEVSTADPRLLVDLFKTTMHKN